MSCEELRNKAGVSTAFERHANLTNEYYERALLSQNPLINSVFSNYKKFKERGFVKLTLLDKVAESGRDRLKSLIDKYNKNIINKKEKYTTTLCNAKLHVRQMILDNYDIGWARTLVFAFFSSFFTSTGSALPKHWATSTQLYLVKTERFFWRGVSSDRSTQECLR